MANSRASIRPLVGLQVRRLCLGYPGWLFVLAIGYLRWNWGQPEGYGGLQDAPLLRLSSALERGLWLWVLFAGLALGLRLRHLSRKEANWLAPLGVGPGAYLFSLWLGTCAASALAIFSLFGTLVLTDEMPAPGHAIDRVISWRSDAVIAPGEALHHEVDSGDSDRFAILVRPTVGASPTTDARLILGKGASFEQTEQRILRLSWLQAPIPKNDPLPLRVTLANTGDGSLGVLGSRSLLTLSAQGGAAHWWKLGLGAWLWSCLWLALLITACTWLRPTMGLPLALLLAWVVGHLWPDELSAWTSAIAWQRAGFGAPDLAISNGVFVFGILATCWFVARRGLNAWGIDR